MELINKIDNNSAVVAIIGLGYVGLPLALEFAGKGFKVLGFDIDESKIPVLNSGKSYIKHIKEEKIKNAVLSKKFSATSDFSQLTLCDAVIICVPTPLDEHNEPDLTYIVNSGKLIAQNFRRGQLIVLESSTYPGTTEEILLPMIEGRQIQSNIQAAETMSKLVVGKDFYLAFSPEREDPNNPDFSTATIPKIVGGVTPDCLKVAVALYNKIIVKTIPVSSPKVAESAKLLENIYRSVNIALVNELKMVFDRMDINVWEVIDAAKTKPFGFHAFYPGPGLGGHCIPIDPFYLTWKAHEYDINTRFIELAGDVNTSMPYYVVERVFEALNKNKKPLNGSKTLILGAAYKKNIDDMRESPTLKLIEILRSKGAEVDYNDPFIPKLPATRKYHYKMSSVELTAQNLSLYDLVLISTDHTYYRKNAKFIYENARLIVDTRNVFTGYVDDNNKLFKA